MQQYRNNVQDQFGNIITGVTVTVNVLPGGGLATIFSDDGVTPKANPFTNAGDSEFFFYAENGRYDIELTGPLTETIPDIRLLDLVGAGASSFRVFTDIATATPPTTEAVTGNFEIWDFDNDDQLAALGFNGTNRLALRNYMHGGDMRLVAEDASGNVRSLLIGDPDGTVDIYNPNGNVKRLSTLTTGRIELFSDGDTDAENRFIAFSHQDGVDRAQVGHRDADTRFTIRNMIHGGPLSLAAEDAGGNVRAILDADPDSTTTLNADTDLILQRNVGENFITAVAGGSATIFSTLNEPGIILVPNSETQIYANNIRRLVAGLSGTVGVLSDGNTDTESRRIYFYQQGGTIRGEVGYISNDDFNVINRIHGALTRFYGEDAGGTLREMMRYDPDSSVILYYNATSALQTRSSTGNTHAQVKHADGNFYDIGLARLPINNISAAEDIDELNQQFYTRKTSGGAISLELQNDSSIQTGTGWQISNHDTEAVTIDATTNTCTLNFLSGSGAPGSGNRTLAQGGVCTIIKISVAEYDIFGNAGLT